MTHDAFEAGLSRTANHQLLATEVYGDTLIVTPHGDETGYGPTVFSKELNRISELLESDRVRHLVIDLGSAPYFGSKMIGGFVQLKRSLRDGGQVLFCEPSREMRVTLECMHIDRLIPIVPTRREALRQVSTITVAQRLEPVRRRWPWAAVLLLFAAGWFVAMHTTLLAAWIGTRETRDYERVVNMYHRIRDVSRGSERLLPGESWRDVQRDCEDVTQPIKLRYRTNRPDQYGRIALREAAYEVLVLSTMSTAPQESRLHYAYVALQQAHDHFERDLELELTSPAPVPEPFEADHLRWSGSVFQPTEDAAPSDSESTDAPAASAPEPSPTTADEPPPSITDDPAEVPASNPS